MVPSDDVRELGKSLALLHMKLGGVQATLQSLAPASAPVGQELETLLDLLDAVDGALERRDAAADSAEPPPGPPAKRGWFGRRIAAEAPGHPAPDPDRALWQGLAVASAAAHERLGRTGVEPIPTSGPLDSRLHRVIDTLSGGQNPEPSIHRTARRGWTRRAAGATEVLRTAHVIAQRRSDP